MKKILALVFAACALALAGCASFAHPDPTKLPAFSFESWSHSDRYGAFTDQLTVSGAQWTVNPDGSATLRIDKWDGDVAWAGAVGPHDTFSKLVFTFPPGSPQAKAAAMPPPNPGQVALPPPAR